MLTKIINYFKKDKIPIESYIVIKSKDKNFSKKLLNNRKFFLICLKKLEEEKAEKLILEKDSVSIEIFPCHEIKEKLTAKERILFWEDSYKKYKMQAVCFVKNK